MNKRRRDYDDPEDYGLDGSADENSAGHRYRLNKRKFFGSVFTLLFIAAAGIAGFFFLKNLLPEIEKPVSAQEPKGIPAAKETALKPAAAGNENAGTISGKTVVLDAGHGGADNGATGFSGTLEDQLNLQVAKFLEEQLETAGMKVIMTREDEDAIAETKDADMAKRRQIITESGSDIVVSIHMNWFQDEATDGPIVLYMPGSEKGQKLAESVQAGINGILKPETACKTRTDGTLFILKSGNQPCILIECGFISNPDEEAALKNKDYQKKLAQAIRNGIEDYFGGGEMKIQVK